MGNWISNESISGDEGLHLSNGATSVFLSVVALAGSYLGRSQREVELTTWLCSQDQHILGRGCIYFDINEMPWTKTQKEFEVEKSFMLKVIKVARTKEGWENLDYEPQFVEEYLKKFEAMISSLEVENVKFDPESWGLKPDEFGKKCSKHSVFLHSLGCIVCHD